MPHAPRPLLRSATPLLPALLLAACASAPLPLPPVVIAPPGIPPLPLEARQPPAPGWCSPTCSAGLTRLRETWLQRLTLPASPAPPASEPTTKPAKP